MKIALENCEGVMIAGLVGAVLAAIVVYSIMAARSAAKAAELKAKVDELSAKESDAAADLKRQREQSDAELLRQERQYKEQISDLNGKLNAKEDELRLAQTQIGDLKSAAEVKTTELAEQGKRISAQEDHYKQLMKESEERFRNLAQKILDERSAKLKSESEKGLQVIADGLATKIEEFRNRIESINKDAVERSGKMDERIVNLVSQTNAVSAQASNLASAIRGDAQVTGEWGELSLKRILDLAGFNERTDYSYQETFEEDETGRKSKRTDFVIKMTDSRSLVIDSKNTVAAIQEFHATEDGERKRACLNEVLNSVRKHVDEIVKANYQSVVPGAFSTVLMYIPIEEVYLLAMKSEISVSNERISLWEYAARRKVVFVNATSVIPIVKIIEMMWEIERSEKNRQEVTRAAEELLQRANDFIADFTSVGEGLEAIRMKFDSAKKGLIDAPNGQSIAKAVAKLVRLGVKPRTRGGKSYELTEHVKGLIGD